MLWDVDMDPKAKQELVDSCPCTRLLHSGPLAYTDVYVFRKLLETVLQGHGPWLVYVWH